LKKYKWKGKNMKKFGLVLSGGGARGLAHIGVLKVLEENRLRPDFVTGASMGAIIGGVYASGRSVEEMENFVKNFVFGEVLDKKYPLYKFNLLENGVKPKFMKYFNIGISLNSLAKNKFLEPGRKIQYLFRQLTKDKTFEETEIPFACTAVDILTGKVVVLNEGKLYTAMRASMSIPLVFEPVRYKDMLLVDGGVLSNAPVCVARKMGAEAVIAIDVNPPVDRKEEDDVLKTTFHLMWRISEITLDGIYRRELKEADYVVPAHAHIDTLDFSKNEEAIKIGEEAMRKMISDVKEVLEA
jgi:NTE family protein